MILLFFIENTEDKTTECINMKEFGVWIVGTSNKKWGDQKRRLADVLI